MSWETPELPEIQRRYRWVAPIYPLFNIVFGLPPGIRKKAVERLGLLAGGSVLEVGCGTGRNFPLLANAVGPEGHIFGVDATREMLERAELLAKRRKIPNVTLRLEDAAELTLDKTVDAALFSLSYSVIPGEKDALAKAWALVRPGGRLVIMDASVERRHSGRLLRRSAAALSRATVLGNPFKKGWEDLKALAGDVEVQDFGRGLYFIATASKAGRQASP